MGALGQDIRYGLRVLLRQPGFTILAVAMLTIGIGGCAAMIGFADAVYLRAVPYPEPEELVEISLKDPRGRGRTLRRETVRHLLAGSPLAAVAGEEWAFRTLTGAGEPESVQGNSVTDGFLDLFGVEPAIGRGFLPRDFEPGAEPVVILSSELFHRQLGGDRSWIGRSVMLDGVPHTLVGVLAPGTYFPREGGMAFLVPGKLDSAGPRSLQAFGRLPPGATLEQTEADLQHLVKNLQDEQGDERAGWTLSLRPVTEKLLARWRPKLALLLGAVGFVLLIACANVAQMLLGRATVRAKEIAVRIAMGASKRRLVRQLLVESALLAGVGGTAGGLLALAAMQAVQLTPAVLETTQFQPMELNATVVAAVALISAVTVLLFGTLPALRASRTAPITALQGAAAGNRSGSRTRSLLIATEAALSVALLVSTGLLLESLFRLQDVDLGFNPDRVLGMRVPLPENKYGEPRQKSEFYLRVLDELRSLPGVRDAGLISPAPFGELMYTSTLVPEGAISDGRIGVSNRLVAPGSLRALGVPLLAGRMFTGHDHDAAPDVVVVSETLAKSVWPGQNPVGKQITLGDPGTDSWLTVIGVVGDVRYNSLEADPVNELYRPYTQHPQVSFATGVIVRTSVEPASAAAMVREAVRGLDPEVPISELRTIREAVDSGLTGRRFFLALVTGFAGVALLLAAAGVYGTVSYTVGQSTREIGIRMAIGSSASDIVRLYLTRTLRWVALGIAGGALLSVWGAQLLTNQLFGVSAIEPSVLATTAVVMLAVAGLAAWLPARRAARIHPAAALRSE